MRINVIRKDFTDKSTIGEMFINDKFFCYTLEDVVRGENEPKVFGKTAIPKGKYKMIVNMSNRFKVLMPLLIDVPNFQGIRIHSGNTSAHTEGCILVGMNKSKDFVGMSRIAFNDLMNQLKKDTKFTIEITDIRDAVV